MRENRSKLNMSVLKKNAWEQVRTENFVFQISWFPPQIPMFSEPNNFHRSRHCCRSHWKSGRDLIQRKSMFSSWETLTSTPVKDIALLPGVKTCKSWKEYRRDWSQVVIFLSSFVVIFLSSFCHLFIIASIFNIIIIKDIYHNPE